MPDCCFFIISEYLRYIFVRGRHMCAFYTHIGVTVVVSNYIFQYKTNESQRVHTHSLKDNQSTKVWDLYAKTLKLNSSRLTYSCYHYKYFQQKNSDCARECSERSEWEKPQSCAIIQPATFIRAYSCSVAKWLIFHTVEIAYCARV